MRHRPLPSLLLLAALAALVALSAPAFASYGDKPDMPAPQPATSARSGDPQETDGQPSAREQADRYYRDAYDDVMKGSKDLADGKTGPAHKKFQRALDHSREAVALDSTRYDAWNLLGFTSRQLGDYPHSFEAYRVALRQKPDYALAREYYGEGLLETGDLAGALEQLAWLKRIGDAGQLASLQGAVDRYRTAHPDATASARPDSSMAAHPDSSTAAGQPAK